MLINIKYFHSVFSTCFFLFLFLCFRLFPFFISSLSIFDFLLTSFPTFFSFTFFSIRPFSVFLLLLSKYLINYTWPYFYFFLLILCINSKLWFYTDLFFNDFPQDTNIWFICQLFCASWFQTTMIWFRCFLNVNLYDRSFEWNILLIFFYKLWNN